MIHEPSKVEALSLPKIWADLRPGECRRIVFHKKLFGQEPWFRAAGLRICGYGKSCLAAEVIPSWLLPPIHPELRFSRKTIDSTLGEPCNLWEDPGTQTINQNTLKRLMRIKSASSWWLKFVPQVRSIVLERLLVTRSLIGAVTRVISTRLGSDVAVISINVTGSFLWSETPPESIDIIAIVDAQIFEHEERVVLLQNEEITLEGHLINTIDLIMVGLGCLRDSTQVSGTIGQWQLPDGRPFPYDIRKRTVIAALRQTLPGMFTIYGRDFSDMGLRKPSDLLALAYYFLQEASILLNFRLDIVKAARRLLEANLVLDFTLGLFGAYHHQLGPQGVLKRCLNNIRRATADPAEPSVIAELCGWWGRKPPSILHLTLQKLFSCMVQVGGYGSMSVQRGSVLFKEAQPPRSGYAAYEHRLQRIRRRASCLREPAWDVLIRRLQRFEHNRHVVSLLKKVSEGTKHQIFHYNDLILPDGQLQCLPMDVELSNKLLLRFLDLGAGGSYFQRQQEQQIGSDFFFSSLPTFERTRHLYGLRRLFLGDIPQSVWLGDFLGYR